MAETFKVGDLVELKSGGPAMTVMRVDDEGHVHTNWFSGRDRGKLEKGEFPIEALRASAGPARFYVPDNQRILRAEDPEGDG